MAVEFDKLLSQIVLHNHKDKASVTSAAREIYVDPSTGNDTTGTGSTSTPYLTLAKAVSTLPAIIAHNVGINLGAGTTTETTSTTLAGITVLGGVTLTIRGRNTSDVNLYDNGTASSGGASTLTDTGEAWTTNIFTNGYITIQTGTGKGQIRQIASNTADEITITSPWTTQPDSTSTYTISGVAMLSGGGTVGSVISLAGHKNISLDGFGVTNCLSSSSAYMIDLAGSEVNPTDMLFICDKRSGMRYTSLSKGQVLRNVFYLTVSSARTGLQARFQSNLDIRPCTFISLTAGANTGLNVTEASFVTIGTGGSLCHFQDLSIGISVGSNVASNEIFASASSATSYTGCTIDYTIGTSGTFQSFKAGVIVADDDITESTALVTELTTPTSAADAGGALTIMREDTVVDQDDLIGRLQFASNDATLTTQHLVGRLDMRASQSYTTDAAPGYLSLLMTPATVAGSPVEVMRVLNNGTFLFANFGTLGSELVTNGDFAVSTGWTFNTGWSYDGTSFEADHASNGTGTLTRTVTIEVGKLYKLVYTVKNWTVGTVTPAVGGVTLPGKSANGTYTHYFLATATTTLTFTTGSTARLSVDDVSIKEITGGVVNIAGSLQVDSIVNDTGLAHGTYTPTRSAEANLDSNVTMTEAQYMRVGNTVTVSGRFTADPTLTATVTSFEITLPVASNVGAAEDIAGTAFCGSIAGMGAEIIGVAANDTAKIQWVASDVTSQTWSYQFSYQVI